MQRQVWSLDELRGLLKAVALAGGDPRTLVILATALGLPVAGVPATGDNTPNAERTGELQRRTFLQSGDYVV